MPVVKNAGHFILFIFQNFLKLKLYSYVTVIRQVTVTVCYVTDNNVMMFIHKMVDRYVT